MNKLQEMKQIKKAIKAFRKIRRRPPKEFTPEILETISFALDYLEEDFEINSRNRS